MKFPQAVYSVTASVLQYLLLRAFYRTRIIKSEEHTRERETFDMSSDYWYSFFCFFFPLLSTSKGRSKSAPTCESKRGL